MEGDGAAAGEGGGGRRGVSDFACLRGGDRVRGSGTWFVLVNRKMQQAAGARVGRWWSLRCAPDLEERQAEMPEELAKLLKRGEGAGEVVRRLSE